MKKVLDLIKQTVLNFFFSNKRVFFFFLLFLIVRMDLATFNCNFLLHWLFLRPSHL